MRGILIILGLGLFVAGAVAVGLQVTRLGKESDVIATSNSLVWEWLGTTVPPSFKLPSVSRDEINDRWIVTGTLTRGGQEGSVPFEPYQAMIEQVCRDSGDRACWKLTSLTVAGQEIEPDQAAGGALQMAQIESQEQTAPAPEASAPQAAEIPDDNAQHQNGVETGGTGASGLRAVERTVASNLEEAPGEQVAADSPTGRELVRRIQAALREFGLNPGPADGVIGPRTREAISSFQEERGLPVNGEPSLQLLQAMETDL